MEGVEDTWQTMAPVASALAKCCGSSGWEGLWGSPAGPLLGDAA